MTHSVGIQRQSHTSSSRSGPPVRRRAFLSQAPDQSRFLGAKRRKRRKGRKAFEMAAPWLGRFLRLLAGIVLALGLAAGLLYAGTIAAPEYLPIARAAMGLGGLGLGYLLGQAVRPLGRWRPPVPPSPETAAP